MTRLLHDRQGIDVGPEQAQRLARVDGDVDNQAALEHREDDRSIDVGINEHEGLFDHRQNVVECTLFLPPDLGDLVEIVAKSSHE